MCLMERGSVLDCDAGIASNVSVQRKRCSAEHLLDSGNRDEEELMKWDDYDVEYVGVFNVTVCCIAMRAC
jgi:hypothetical protein